MFTLKVSGIGKNYGETLVFKNISFQLNQGDVLAITGWNGSGKSTLLRIIAGLVKPATGQVEMFFNADPIPKESRRATLDAKQGCPTAPIEQQASRRTQPDLRTWGRGVGK